MLKQLLLTCLLSLSTISFGAEKLLDLPLKAPDTIASMGKGAVLKGDEWLKGKSRQFLNFDGLGSYIYIPSKGLMPKHFSLCFWLNPKLKGSTLNGSTIFMSPNVEGSGFRRGFSVFGKAEAGKYRLQLTMSYDGGRSTFELPQIPVDQFSFIAFNWDGRTVRGYINNQEVLTKKWHKTLIYSTKNRPLCIGARGYSRHPYYGVIANLKFYKGAMSATELKDIYQHEKADMVLNQKKVSFKDQTYIKSDKLTMPNKALSRNLLQNPSFEGGLRWWKATIPIVDIITESPAGIDSTVARTGNQSLYLKGVPNSRELVKVNALPVIVKTGQDYTVSFYAKASIPVKLTVIIYTGYWPVFPATKAVKLSAEWQRFSLTFKAPNSAACPVFSLQRNPKENCTAWIDDVQMEKGANMTEFTKKPLDMELLTNARGNVVIDDAKADAKLRIHTDKPESNGNVQITIYDYMKRILNACMIPFATNAKGDATISLPKLDELPKGAFLLSAACKLNNGFNDQDFFRFGRISSVKKNFKLKNFFAGNIPSRFPTTKAALDLYELYGLGNMKWGLIEKDFADLLKERGIVHRGELFFHKASYLLDGKDGYKKPTYKWYRGADGKKDTSHYVKNRWNEKLDDVVEASIRVATKNPYITEWQTCGEGLMSGDENRMERTIKYMELHRRIAEGIKKVNPKNRLYSVSTTNLYQSNGIKQIEETMKCGAGEIFDVITAHTYRPRPENPDFDLDIAAFIKMLDKYNCQKNIYFEEDMNYPAYAIPTLGMDPTKFADFWRGRALCYDIGLGERISSAYNARTWLIALKYYPRVQRMLWHLTSNTILDAKGNLRISPWTSNTIANLFGNGIEYLSTIGLSDDVRCYLYKDAEGRPLAALWNINEDVDREKRLPFTFKMPFSAGEASVIDIFNNVTPATNGKSVAILPMPMFIRGHAGSIDAFKQKMESIKVAGSPLRLVNVESKLNSPESVRITITNRLSKNISGTLSVVLQGKKVLEQNEIHLAALEAKNVTITSPTVFTELENVSLQIEFDGKGDYEMQRSDASFVYMSSQFSQKELTIDGDLADWGNDNWIDISNRQQGCKAPAKLLGTYAAIPPYKGENDLSVKFKTMWNDSYFYLAVKVKDDTFAQLPIDKNYFWQYDSLQVYFDTFGDARSKATKGYDNSDYCYNFFVKNNIFQKKRDQVPEWQLCFLSPGIADKVKGVFKQTVDGYVYEIAWPGSELSPLSLTSGNSFGFAMLINENDNDYRKRAISLTPKGTSPYQRPHLWPAMLLKK